MRALYADLARTVRRILDVIPFPSKATASMGLDAEFVEEFSLLLAGCMDDLVANKRAEDRLALDPRSDLPVPVAPLQYCRAGTDELSAMGRLLVAALRFTRDEWWETSRSWGRRGQVATGADGLLKMK